MAMKQGGDQCACTVRVGEKGQIVIPKEARDMFGIKPGDTLLLLADRQRGIAIPPKSEFEKMTDENRDEVIENTKHTVMDMLKKTIRPEFLNRIDETIMFLPLTKKEIADVVSLQIGAVQKMLAEQDVTLNVTPEAINFLADVGFDPEFGARPVKRAIQRYVLNDLSKKLLSGEVNREKPIVIDSYGEGLMFRN